ncbi:hypothetical protein Bca101_022664 [Brassica carinata]
MNNSFSVQRVLLGHGCRLWSSFFGSVAHATTRNLEAHVPRFPIHRLPDNRPITTFGWILHALKRYVEDCIGRIELITRLFLTFSMSFHNHTLSNQRSAIRNISRPERSIPFRVEGKLSQERQPPIFLVLNL